MTEEKTFHRRPATDMDDVLLAWKDCKHNVLYEDRYVMRLSKWDDATVWIMFEDGKLNLVPPTDLTIEIL